MPELVSLVCSCKCDVTIRKNSKIMYHDDGAKTSISILPLTVVQHVPTIEEIADLRELFRSIFMLDKIGKLNGIT